MNEQKQEQNKIDYSEEDKNLLENLMRMNQRESKENWFKAAPLCDKWVIVINGMLATAETFDTEEDAIQYIEKTNWNMVACLIANMYKYFKKEQNGDD